MRSVTEEEIYKDRCIDLRARMNERSNSRKSNLSLFALCIFATSLITSFGVSFYHKYYVIPSMRYLRAKVDLRSHIESSHDPVEFAQVANVLEYLLERTKEYDKVFDEKIVSDIPVIKPKVIKIKVASAYLRTYPSKDSEPLMTMSKGAELVVIEEGDTWTKVHAPTGEEAWVMNEVLEITK